MNKTKFNKNWHFYKEGQEQERTLVHLPHDAMIQEVRAPNCANAHHTGFYPGGKYIYRKQWLVPSDWRKKIITLEFEGIYGDSKVYINGVLAGTCQNPYKTFYVTCDELLHFGTKNEVLVKVDNSNSPNSRWYSGSGIYRNVHLYLGGQSHIAINGIKIKSLSIQPAEVSITTKHTGGEIQVEILYDGTVVAHGKGNQIELEIPDAKLWCDEQPNLYQAKVRLLENEEVVEEVIENFGIRMIHWEAGKGFFINNKPMLLRGGCIHHDNGVLGASCFEDAETRRVRILKKAGFNAIRSAHHPCSKALLHACDMYGVYIMDELTDMWYIHKTKYDYATHFPTNYAADIQAMVDKDYNHPSVIMYSLGNEVTETAEAKGIELLQMLQDQLHLLDDTRPVTCGINLFLNGLHYLGRGHYKNEDKTKNKQPKSKERGSAFINKIMTRIGKFMLNRGTRFPFIDRATKDAYGILDIAGYNYGSGRYAKDARKYPARLIVGSESFPPSLPENWTAVQQYPNLIGDFVWTAWDYLGEAGIGAVGYKSLASRGVFKSYPYRLSECGMIDITGFMRPEVYMAQLVWGLISQPYIGVEPLPFANDKKVGSIWRDSDAVHSWSWEGYEHQPTTIVVYANAAKVELFVNAKSMGISKVKAFRAIFKTTYIPGTLTAIAYDARGKETGRDVLRTANTPTILRLTPEQDVLRANGADLAYINIALTDDNGVLKPLEQKIDVTVSGVGTLAGFGSASPYSEDHFTDTSCHTYRGRALVVVRAGYEIGEIWVRLKGKGFLENSLCIKVKQAASKSEYEN